MARANTYTRLPLDVWARAMGINLWLFNGFSQFPTSVGESCQDIWYQYPEQYDTVSKEELADAIAQAESVLEDYLGFNMLPDWTHNERVRPPRYNYPGYHSNLAVTNKPKSVRMSRGYILQVGVKTSKFLENVAVTRIDKDGDGFAETAEITITDWGVDTNQLRVYYPDESGADEWEIRPVKFIDNTTIHIPAYQIPKGELVEQISPLPLNPLDATVYLETVDIYQVYNDIAEPISLIYDNPTFCNGCTQYTIPTCGYVQDEKLGYIVYNPNLYSLYQWYDPDNLEISYLSGWRSNKTRNLVDIDQKWVYPIAYFAVGFLNRTLRNCNGETRELSGWGEDLVRQREFLKYGVTNEMLNNPLGLSTKGAWFALQRIKQYRLGN